MGRVGVGVWRWGGGVGWRWGGGANNEGLKTYLTEGSIQPATRPKRWQRVGGREGSYALMQEALVENLFKNSHHSSFFKQNEFKKK